MLCLTIMRWTKVALTVRGSIREIDTRLYTSIANRLNETGPSDVSMCVVLDDEEIARVNFILKPAHTKGAPHD